MTLPAPTIFPEGTRRRCLAARSRPLHLLGHQLLWTPGLARGWHCTFRPEAGHTGSHPVPGGKTVLLGTRAQTEGPGGETLTTVGLADPHPRLFVMPDTKGSPAPTGLSAEPPSDSYSAGSGQRGQEGLGPSTQAQHLQQQAGPPGASETSVTPQAPARHKNSPDGRENALSVRGVLPRAKCSLGPGWPASALR